MHIISVADYEQLSEEAYETFIETLTSIKHPVFGLATGSTPKGMYKLLEQDYIQRRHAFNDITTFNLDEYIGLPKEHEGSYYYYMYERFFKPLELEKEQCFVPNGLATDLAIECTQYEEKIKRAGGIDLQFLGIGVNGHIGFNEPGTPFTSRTHVVQLTESTIEVNSRFFTTKEEMPTRAISMGIESIMESKKIVLFVNGKHKAEAVKQTIQGEVSEEFPASILQLHPDVTVIADKEALSALKM